MKSEVFKRELNYISDIKIREEGFRILDLLPDYFYVIPASSSGKYHPNYALGDGGLVRHTKAAVRIAWELLQNNSIGETFNDKEKDLILLSLLLHDGLKSGLVKEQYTVFEHSLLMADFVKKNSLLSNEDIDLVTSMIASHNGKGGHGEQWNTSKYSRIVLPSPVNKYQKFVHMCDYLASRKFIEIKFENNDIID